MNHPQATNVAQHFISTINEVPVHTNPLPNITDILDQLGSAKYFSILDLASGFY